MILHLYFLRRFLVTFLLISLVFVILLALIDLVDELQDYPNLPFVAVLEIVLLNIPFANYEILPLVIILATVTVFLRFARSSELVVVRATGRSGIVQLIAPVVGAAIIGILAITLFNPIVATASKRYEDLTNSYVNQSISVLALSEDGLWLRQGDEDGQVVIHAETANADLTDLKTATFLFLNPNGESSRRINADFVQLKDGYWQLQNAKDWNLENTDNPEANARYISELRVDTNLTKARIIESFGKPEHISFWSLPGFIERLETAGFSARRYQIWHQTEIAKPLFLIALVLMSAAFTMEHIRLSNTGIAVLSALLMGFGMHYIRNFAQILGENGQIPVLLAAWSPPIAALMLAFGIILHKEDG